MKRGMQQVTPTFILLLFFTIAATAQTTSNPPLITVSGEAAVKVTPDEVVFRLEVENVDKDLIAAKNLNDERVKAVLALARSYQIDSQDIRTDYISIQPKYDFEDDDKKRTFAGYEVSKTVVIVLKDFSRFDSLLSDVIKLGVTRVSDVTFRTSQIRKHKDQARALAIKAAREKALAIAQEIGQTIGKAYSIQEEGAVNRFDGRNATTVISGSYSDSESSIAPGQISVTARVVASFELK
ncbi:MAG: 26 kDa periplasmic immunogenic protein [Gammaproteobacteria bacterium]|nr:26 kDa periplasmic immunogenic protein [Gammaproteobacteria bacterium]